MGLSRRLVLFSEVRGTVLKDGQPVSGAELVQTARISSDAARNPVQRTTTGPDGKFHFPKLVKTLGLFSRMLPGQPVVNQSITIRYQGREYEGWKHGKPGFEADAELDGQPMDFVCELTDAPETVGTHYGICKPVFDLSSMNQGESPCHPSPA